MTAHEAYEFDDKPQPFKAGPGFYAFLGALFLPVLIALAIYLGAWAVAADVRAAEAAGPDGQGQAVSNSLNGEQAHVAGWKKTLVGICPAH
jgi:hypothetical protein